MLLLQSFQPLFYERGLVYRDGRPASSSALSSREKEAESDVVMDPETATPCMERPNFHERVFGS